MKKLFLFTLLFACTTLLSAQTRQWRDIHHGNKAFAKEDFGRAEQEYLKALNGKEKNARALFNLGDTYLAKGNAEAALKQFEQAAELETNSTIKGMAHYQQGVVEQMAAGKAQQQERQQHLRQAIDHYKQALRLNPHDNQARYNMALCQKQLKDENNGGGGQNQPKSEPKQDNQQQKDEQEKQQQPQDQQQARQQQQLQQLMNLTRQAEQRAREKVNNARRPNSPKARNW